ncbi:MAG TPA: arginyltransferase [Stellaceae bacterium]|nr:arginyltransferase [Stellaceae bacterium]
MKRLIPPSFQQFYRTSAQPCPYVEGRLERKVITEISGPLAAAIYNELSRAGFRRSHSLAYRPACGACVACLPVRIVASAFVGGRSARRIERMNEDLRLTDLPPRATPEQYRLFRRYQHARHAESDMATMSYGDYAAMVESSPLDTVLLAARDRDGRLVAACLADELDDGCSAVYSFFEPNEPKRGLGTWLVLQLVERARRRGQDYVYLGYWIAGSAKMDYKIRFRPLEALGAEGWSPVAAAAAMT